MNTALSNDLAWRKKELSYLKSLIDMNSIGVMKQNALGRCGIAILYAHWEGYIKLSSQYYLEFIAMQRLRNSELRHNLLTVSLRKKINLLDTIGKVSASGRITEFFLNSMGDRAKIPYKDSVDTKSNLSSKVFKEIIWMLGLDYSPYETMEKLIDSKLLAKRNHIAHGEWLSIDPTDYFEMRTSVIDMLDCFKSQIEVAAINEAYKK